MATGGNLLEGAAVGTVTPAAATFTDVTLSGGFLHFNVTTGITAGSTQTQAGATALTTGFNVVSTVGTQYDGVKLPAAAAGKIVFLQNLGANNLKIWPASGDDLGEGVDTGRTWNSSGANSKVAFFIAQDATTWARGEWSQISIPI